MRPLLARSCLLFATVGCGDDLSLAADAGGPGADASIDVDAGPKGELWFRRESGKIMALREQTELFLDDERAAEIDELLQRAKQVKTGVSWIDLSDWYARSKEDLERIHVVVYDPEVAEAWKRGELTTRNAELDSLVAALETTRITYWYLDRLDYEFYELWFARWVNVHSLAARLNELGFVEAFVQPWSIDGSDIELSVRRGPGALPLAEHRRIDATQFTFYLKWGDCSSGCIWSHYWEVLVPRDPDLPAELVGEGGDSLTPP